MKKIKIDAFKTTDGNVFTDESEAVAHQEKYDSMPDTYPYFINLKLDIRVVWDLEIDPNDPNRDAKIKCFMNKHLDDIDEQSLRSVAADGLAYADVVGLPEFISVEEG